MKDFCQKHIVLPFCLIVWFLWRCIILLWILITTAPFYFAAAQIAYVIQATKCGYKTARYHARYFWDN